MTSKMTKQTRTAQDNQNPVPAIIRAAFQGAGHRAADKAELTAATLAGLRKLRRVLAAQAGPEPARQVVDSPVAGFILERNLRALSATGVEPAPLDLPASPALAGSAAALMLDAVETGLMLHRFLPGNSALTCMAPELMDCLCETLGGTPDTGALLDLLRSGTPESDDPRLTMEGVTIHRLH